MFLLMTRRFTVTWWNNNWDQTTFNPPGGCVELCSICFLWSPSTCGSSWELWPECGRTLIIINPDRVFFFLFFFPLSSWQLKGLFRTVIWNKLLPCCRKAEQTAAFAHHMVRKKPDENRVAFTDTRDETSALFGRHENVDTWSPNTSNELWTDEQTYPDKKKKQTRHATNFMSVGKPQT